MDFEPLTNVLKTYALCNPEIEYCQGMNFISGLFYLFFNDEDTTFKALFSIIERWNMGEAFNTN